MTHRCLHSSQHVHGNGSMCVVCMYIRILNVCDDAMSHSNKKQTVVVQTTYLKKFVVWFVQLYINLLLFIHFVFRTLCILSLLFVVNGILIFIHYCLDSCAQYIVYNLLFTRCVRVQTWTYDNEWYNFIF